MAAVHAIEADFLARLDALRRDSVKAATFVYTLGAFNQRASGDSDLRDKINEHPAFWLTVLGALQAAGFAALGRMYQPRPDSHHIPGLLKSADVARGIFSRQALEARRIAAGMAPRAAREFAAGASAPGDREFDQLRAEYGRCKAIYDGRVQRIRHDAIAHTGRIPREELLALLAALPTRDFESVTVFPLQLHDALFHTYHDGLPLTLRPAPSDVVEIVGAGPLGNVSTWEHLHAVDAVVRFLRSVGRAPD